jgi:probable DNA metabolism protein
MDDLFDGDVPDAGEEPDEADWEALFEYSARARGAALTAGMSELPVEADINRYVLKVLAAARKAEALAGGRSPAEAQLAAREAADKAATDRGDPAVRAVLAAAFKVDKEIERMKGMLRFCPGEDGLYLARCAPDHFVLPALAGHFKSRFGGSPWAILDEKRGLALVCRAGEDPRMEPGSLQSKLPRGFAAVKRCLMAERSSEPQNSADYFPETNPEGDGWEELWRTYHRSISIENRKNAELQKRFMPARYWKYLTELQHEVNAYDD